MVPRSYPENDQNFTTSKLKTAGYASCVCVCLLIEKNREVMFSCNYSCLKKQREELLLVSKVYKTILSIIISNCFVIRCA